MNSLQLRFTNESEGILKHAQDLEANQKLFVALREAEAAVKTAEEHRDTLKEEVRLLCEDGEKVGYGGFYYTLQARATKRFDIAQAIKAGVLTEEQAKPFFKIGHSRALVMTSEEVK